MLKSNKISDKKRKRKKKSLKPKEKDERISKKSKILLADPLRSSASSSAATQQKKRSHSHVSSAADAPSSSAPPLLTLGGHRTRILSFDDGVGEFRARLICSTLSGMSCFFKNIHVDEENVGLQEHELALLNLLDKICNGTRIVIGKNGTTLTYIPGLIVNGSNLTHDCGAARGISYFLEVLIALAPFGKFPLNITLNGITNCEEDLSPDLLRTVTLPILAAFGIEDGLELKILKRGARPDGGGAVKFQCNALRALKPIELTDSSKVRRIRGIAYATRISPKYSSRMAECAKGLLTQAVADVYIYTDHYKGKESGLSPGFGLCLVSEAVKGGRLSAEAIGKPGETPENTARRAVAGILRAIEDGGAVDASNQWLTLLFMALCDQEVSKVRLGKLTAYSIATLRLIREALGVTFKIEEDRATKTVIFTCLGGGMRNFSKRVT